MATPLRTRQPVDPDVRALTPDVPRSSHCLNCGAAMHGQFCSQCGQRDVPPYPSVRELVVDAFWELSGWDGRFATTVRALVRHPGLLTREFLEGRRARYISPLRLYLVASLVYFVVAASAPRVNMLGNSGGNFVGAEGPGFKIGTTAAPESRAARVGNTASESMRTALGDTAGPRADSVTAERRQTALRDIERAPAIFRPVLRRAIADPKGFQHSIVVAMPRMLFALLPVFAAIVALFYRGRKYPEHLYFAIHVHAFVFLAMTAIELFKFTHYAALVQTTGVLGLIAMFVYATVAFRRTYGGTFVGTVGKEMGIGLLYFVAASIAFLTTIYVVSVFG